MNVARETIAAALQKLVFAVANFKTTGERVLHWDQVANQPACFVRWLGDAYGGPDHIMVPVTLHFEVWFYVKAPSPTDSAAEPLRELVDNLETVLAPDDPATNRLTLGGLVQDCRLEGESLIDQGDIGGQGKAVIPVRVEVPWVRMWAP
jgi:hypothetical protein